MVKLLESDFLTVDLSSIAKNQRAANNINTVKQSATDKSNKQPISDWGKELETRLENNRKLSPEAQVSEYVIESEFFKEYFNKNWESAVAKQLETIGEPLKKAIKVLGFARETNPILAFISNNNFVIPNLIKTKLLNEATFKAIYNAVAKKLVAQSQFLKENNYNIIYCPDLYKKPLAEIMKYLELQSNILSATAAKYTKADIAKNIKVFLELPGVTEKEFSKRLKQIDQANVAGISVQTMKLNSIKLATVIESKLGRTDQDGKHVHIGTEGQKQLAQKLNTPAKKLAAIQFISMTTNSVKAKEALVNEKFAKVSRNDLVKATLQIARDMPAGALLTKDADNLVSILLSD